MKHIEAQPDTVLQIPIDQLVPDLQQPRKAFREKPLEELAENIKARGVLQPITVIPSGAHQFMIKMGERRYRAAKLAGLEAVPCLLDSHVDDSDNDDLLLDQLAENNLREDLDPIERARALDRLREKGLGPKAISELLAKHGVTMSRPAISNTLRLLKLPESAQQLVVDGTLKESYARMLVPYTEWPKVIEDICREVAENKWDLIDEEWMANSIDSTLAHIGTAIRKEDGCGKDCDCLATVKFAHSQAEYCMEPKRLEKKRASSPATEEKAAHKPPPVEKDPTKVKPKKVTPNKAGVVPLKRRQWNSYKSLDGAPFDTSECDGCPHKHLADHNGNKNHASDYCFYPPCFENLERQQRKIDNRKDTIRELIDDQLLPVLIETASTSPVAETIVLPLLAYVSAGFPIVANPTPDPRGLQYMIRPQSAAPERWGSSARSHLDGLHALPAVTGKGTLTVFLEKDIEQNAGAFVDAAIRALHHEQRRELAQHLSIDVSAFWSNSEDYAKLFTKPEIVKLLEGKFEPPDVPAGEWRARYADDTDLPVLVRELWDSPIANIDVYESSGED